MVGRFLAYTPNGHVFAHNNVFWDDANFKTYWGGEFTSLTSWATADTTHVYDNLNSDPILTNILTTYPDRDFSLSIGSAASNIGAALAADGTDPFALLQQRYGVDIAKDVVGTTRSLPYSLGAYE